LCIVSCDLFNATTDSDLLAKIDEEIAWANADKLAVTFHAPEGWISSSTPSLSLAAIPGNVIDIRKGSTSAFGFYLYKKGVILLMMKFLSRLITTAKTLFTVLRLTVQAMAL